MAQSSHFQVAGLPQEDDCQRRICDNSTLPNQNGPSHADFRFHHATLISHGRRLVHTESNTLSACNRGSRVVGKLTAEEWRRRVRDAHGGRYRYTHLDGDLCAASKISVICPKHGEFRQRLGDHARGIGCRKCGNERGASIRATTKEDWMRRFRAAHGNHYTYPHLPDKITTSEKIQIVCPKHGEFWQLAKDHASGIGCKPCGYARNVKARTKPREKWLEGFGAKHRNKYDYSLLPAIVKNADRVPIVCPIHGEFTQVAYSHLQGAGCPECKKEVLAQLGHKDASYWLNEFKKAHAGYYSYPSLIGKKGRVEAAVKIAIKCPAHGVFMQEPTVHRKGHGCPACNVGRGGFDITQPAILYYLRITSGAECLYKIGVTNRTIKDRFPEDFKKITVINERQYKSGKLALRREKEFLVKHKKWKYRGLAVLRDGNTELFTKDVLGLDAHEI